MSVVAVLAALASLASGDCHVSPSFKNVVWQSGPKSVIAARREFQSGALGRLSHSPLRQISRVEAIRLSAASDLPKGRYYLARAAYAGPQREPGGAPEGLKFGLDIDQHGNAYVTSFTLAPAGERRTGHVAVVLVSPKALRRAIALCSSAE